MTFLFISPPNAHANGRRYAVPFSVMFGFLSDLEQTQTSLDGLVRA